MIDGRLVDDDGRLVADDDRLNGGRWRIWWLTWRHGEASVKQTPYKNCIQNYTANIHSIVVDSLVELFDNGRASLAVKPSHGPPITPATPSNRALVPHFNFMLSLPLL